MNTFFLNNITIFEINKKYELSKLKVCICTLGKDENRYIREFVEYYKNYGVDKIYLYDNNDINGEKFESVISQYINNKFVEIINWRGMNGKSTYYKIIDSCYQTHHNYYDWLIFYEIHMSDNNNLFYENKTLNERFPNVGKNIVKNKRNKICYVKSIIRGHLKNIKIKHNHLLNKKLKACNGFGEKSKLKKIRSLNPDYKFNYMPDFYDSYKNILNENEVEYLNNNAIIYHYTCDKPWKSKLVRKFDLFWNIAKQTYFYDRILNIYKRYNNFYRHWYERIFSVINKDNHKVITVLGIKVCIKK